MTKRVRSAQRESAGWYTSLTHFVDDYKLRGQDPSTTHGPYFYKTEKAAYAKLIEMLRRELDGMLIYEEDENGEPVEDVDMKAIPADRLYEIACGNVAEYSDITRGEFVPERFDFEFGEIFYESDE